MKLLFVINVDFALRHFLLPLMRGARARGHEAVGVCADGPMLAAVREEGFRVITVPLVRRLAPAEQFRALRALMAVMRAERPDLVHAHMPISGFLARLAARLTAVPRIAYTCHGFLFNQPGPWPRRAASLLLEWIGGRLTDTYLTVSQAEATDARRLWIARHAIAVGNGRDPARFHPNEAARAAIRTAFGVPEDRVVVIALARLVRHKGFPELAAAMRGVDADLWVVGDRLPSDRGPDMAALLDAAGLGSRLRRLGSRNDVPALLAASDVFALPSQFEGLPMSVIEAMLTGLPVVAFDIKGVREQVLHESTGLLAPPGDIPALAHALQRLAADTALRRRLGLAGWVHATNHYNEARVVSRTLDLLGL